jgi:hypothetical protein
MTPIGWTQTAVGERVVNLRREPEHERLLRQRRSPWPGPGFLTQLGDRS